MQMLDLSLDQLQAHPANSNVMPPGAYAKLRDHIQRTAQYPPVIVRPIADGGYQILDGHHRVAALSELGIAQARCVVWDVDDQQALVLLATLNRLQGRDDPRKRAHLLAQLNEQLPLEELARQLPEDLEQLQRLMTLNDPPIAPRPAQDLEQLPVAVHFFLLPKQRRDLDRRLHELGGSREDALMTLVQAQAIDGGDA